MSETDDYIIDKVTADLVRIELLINNIREHLKSYAIYKKIEDDTVNHNQSIKNTTSNT